MAWRDRMGALRRRWEHRKWFVLARGTVRDFAEDKASRLGAALAYYTVFSIAPLLVILIAIAGFFLGEEAARGQLMGGLGRLVGPDGGEAIQTMVAKAYQPGAGLVATALGLVALLFGATGVVAQLKDALNTIWEVKPVKGRGAWRFVRDRVLSLGMVLGLGFLLLVSLAVSSVVSFLGERVGAYLPDGAFLYVAVNFALAFAVTTVGFALLFRFLPDAKVAWRDVWLGAAATSLLFNLGQVAIGLYLGRGSVAGVYGAAGSLVIVLLWVFYSAQIFFLGAEFTQVYANEYGSRVRPGEGAVRVDDEDRAQQGLEPSKRRGGRPG